MLRLFVRSVRPENKICYNTTSKRCWVGCALGGFTRQPQCSRHATIKLEKRVATLFFVAARGDFRWRKRVLTVKVPTSLFAVCTEYVRVPVVRLSTPNAFDELSNKKHKHRHDPTSFMYKFTTANSENILSPCIPFQSNHPFLRPATKKIPVYGETTMRKSWRKNSSPQKLPSTLSLQIQTIAPAYRIAFLYPCCECFFSPF